jgi:hypothetical protein
LLKERIYLDFIGQYKIPPMRVVGLLSIPASIGVVSVKFSHIPSSDEYLLTCAMFLLFFIQTTQKLLEGQPWFLEQRTVPLLYSNSQIDGNGIIILVFLIGSHANILHVPCGE